MHRRKQQAASSRQQAGSKPQAACHTGKKAASSKQQAASTSSKQQAARASTKQAPSSTPAARAVWACVRALAPLARSFELRSRCARGSSHPNPCDTPPRGPRHRGKLCHCVQQAAECGCDSCRSSCKICPVTAVTCEGSSPLLNFETTELIFIYCACCCWANIAIVSLRRAGMPGTLQPLGTFPSPCDGGHTRNLKFRVSLSAAPIGRDRK
jgi:hypothetical protein